MFDLLKKSILASIGAAVVTRDAIMEATRRLVKEGKISTEEAERLADDLVDSGKRQWDEMQSSIRDSIRKSLDNLDIGSKQEFRDLKERVDNLEKRMTLLEDEAKFRKESIIVGP